MCDQIYLTLPPDADADVVERILRDEAKLISSMSRYGRGLVFGDRLYHLQPRGMCFCGTALAMYERDRSSPEDLERRLADDAKRLKKRGWSDGKIRRRVEQEQRNHARRVRDAEESEREIRQTLEDGSSSETWLWALRQVRRKKAASHIGLAVAESSDPAAGPAVRHHLAETTPRDLLELERYVVHVFG